MNPNLDAGERHAEWCPVCRRIAVQPGQHQCPTSTKEKR